MAMNDEIIEIKNEMLGFVGEALVGDTVLLDWAERLDQAIAALQEKSCDWIPASERLPEERKDDVPFRSEDVFVTNGISARRAYWMTRQKHWRFYHEGWNLPITHWMPIILPKQPQPCSTCGGSGRKLIKPIISQSDFPKSAKFKPQLPKTEPCPDCNKGDE